MIIYLSLFVSCFSASFIADEIIAAKNNNPTITKANIIAYKTINIAIVSIRLNGLKIFIKNIPIIVITRGIRKNKDFEKAVNFEFMVLFLYINNYCLNQF